jgi:hypothetical protein
VVRAVPSEVVGVVCGGANGAGPAALTAAHRETPGALPGRGMATANTLVFAPNELGPAADAALAELAELADWPNWLTTGCCRPPWARRCR